MSLKIHPIALLPIQPSIDPDTWNVVQLTMADSKTKSKFTSWAMSTPEDDALWDSMTRAEQLDALRELANHPDTTTATDTTVAEIVERTRAARKAKQTKDDHDL